MDFFTNNKHIYKAIIKSNTYGGSLVKIGGKSYGDCINIGIFEKNNELIGKISHIQSEPECSYDHVIEDGDTVNFVKASLQFCSEKFPGLTIFEFDDMAHIECGVSKTDTPPRKLGKPFSLSYFSIALYGQTWYERHFKAKMNKSKKYEEYRSSIERLNTLIDIPYKTFRNINQIDNEKNSILEKHYDMSGTWISFFNSIPKNKRCDAFFNWLPSFLENELNIKMSSFGWYIDIKDMKKAQFKSLPDKKGGYQTRKQRWKKRTVFKNVFDNTIFYRI